MPWTAGRRVAGGDLSVRIDLQLEATDETQIYTELLCPLPRAISVQIRVASVASTNRPPNCVCAFYARDTTGLPS